MEFMNEEHQKFYESCLNKSSSKDCYHRSLFYILGLTEDCREAIDSLYDWKDRCVKPLNNCGWITGTDIRIIRLAYNLFNNGCPTAFDIENKDDKIDEVMEYTPASIFSYISPELREYCFEGIRIRHEMV